MFTNTNATNAAVADTAAKPKALTPMQKADLALAEAKLKLEQVKNKRAEIEARERTRASKANRRFDDRRKILIGAMMLSHVKQNIMKQAELDTMLGNYLTRADDRVLFNLN